MNQKHPEDDTFIPPYGKQSHIFRADKIYKATLCAVWLGHGCTPKDCSASLNYRVFHIWRSRQTLRLEVLINSNHFREYIQCHICLLQVAIRCIKLSIKSCWRYFKGKLKLYTMQYQSIILLFYDKVLWCTHSASACLVHSLFKSAIFYISKNDFQWPTE